MRTFCGKIPRSIYRRLCLKKVPLKTLLRVTQGYMVFDFLPTFQEPNSGRGKIGGGFYRRLSVGEGETG
jgi:hypothetical protein